MLTATDLAAEVEDGEMEPADAEAAGEDGMQDDEEDVAAHRSHKHKHKHKHVHPMNPSLTTRLI